MQFLSVYGEKLIIALLQHMEILVITMTISLALAAVLTILATYSPRTGSTMVHVFSAIYSIPSLALFAILIPLTGLGMPTAILVLVGYNQYLLLRNFLAGINEVNPSIVDAATGMGMTRMQVLKDVQLPLSRRAIFTGIQLAVISTIGIGTIAALINAGGLGDVLFDGLRTMNTTKIIWGSALSAGLAIGVNAILNKVQGRLAA